MANLKLLNLIERRTSMSTSLYPPPVIRCLDMNFTGQGWCYAMWNGTHYCFADGDEYLPGDTLDQYNPEVVDLSIAVNMLDQMSRPVAKALPSEGQAITDETKNGGPNGTSN